MCVSVFYSILDFDMYLVFLNKHDLIFDLIWLTVQISSVFSIKQCIVNTDSVLFYSLIFLPWEAKILCLHLQQRFAFWGICSPAPRGIGRRGSL